MYRKTENSLRLCQVLGSIDMAKPITASEEDAVIIKLVHSFTKAKKTDLRRLLLLHNAATSAPNTLLPIQQVLALPACPIVPEAMSQPPLASSLITQPTSDGRPVPHLTRSPPAIVAPTIQLRFRGTNLVPPGTIKLVHTFPVGDQCLSKPYIL